MAEQLGGEDFRRLIKQVPWPQPIRPYKARRCVDTPEVDPNLLRSEPSYSNVDKKKRAGEWCGEKLRRGAADRVLTTIFRDVLRQGDGGHTPGLGADDHLGDADHMPDMAERHMPEPTPHDTPSRLLSMPKCWTCRITLGATLAQEPAREHQLLSDELRDICLALGCEA